MAKQTNKPGNRQRRLKIGSLPKPAGKLTKSEQKKIKGGSLMDGSVRFIKDGTSN